MATTSASATWVPPCVSFCIKVFVFDATEFGVGNVCAARSGRSDAQKKSCDHFQGLSLARRGKSDVGVGNLGDKDFGVGQWGKDDTGVPVFSLSSCVLPRLA